MSRELFEHDTQDNFVVSEIKKVIQDGEIRTESGEKILSIREFNPKIDKGVYVTGENHHTIHQNVISIEENNVVRDIEVFTKCIIDPSRASVEREAYRRCALTNTPTLKFLASIPTEIGIFNITKTENYLIPYSRLKVTDIQQYISMRERGLLAIEQVHRIGILHRDILTRNIAAVTNSPLQTIVFDFESSQVYPQNTQLTEEQKQLDRELYLESLFFQLLKQNPNNKDLISKAEKIS